MKKPCLTNERLAGRFRSQFELVNYAIKLAGNMIHTGRESRYKTHVQNRAYQILEEIAHGLDRFDDVSAIPKETREFREHREPREPREPREERPKKLAKRELLEIKDDE